MEEQKRLVGELQREIAEVQVRCGKVGACTIAVPCFVAALLLPGNEPTPGSTQQRAPAAVSAQGSKLTAPVVPQHRLGRS